MLMESLVPNSLTRVLEFFLVRELAAILPPEDSLSKQEGESFLIDFLRYQNSRKLKERSSLYNIKSCNLTRIY
jgi:hypothetical protein